MTALHIVLGVGVVAVNLAAGLLGAWRWHRDDYSRAFWPLLRTGQALVVIEVLQGGVLLLLGHDLPRLHLIYGLVPLGVAFIAEQLRLTSAQAVLDQRGVRTARELAPAEREDAALDILRREMGVMAASALVVAALGLRAGGVL
ncbi:MAG: hypothetical protein M3N56_16995 [Actinomycetota bacterium]|nr:hypothetical protein [Actinomycetota bacterium]